MKSKERILKIFEMIQADKYVSVKELAEYFNVSLMTIRRDLARLEKDGVLTTNYGGATLNEGASAEPSFTVKSGTSKEYKNQIAYYASTLVQDGECIYLDCGTTVSEMMKYLTKKKITIITNSWKILEQLEKRDFSRIKLILAPGEYDPISEGALSSETIDFFSQYIVDKAFMSTQGIDYANGVTVPDRNDSLVKRAILSRSKEKILLVDHTKFNQSYFACFGATTDFDLLITDKEISDETYNLFKKEHNILKI